jgi:hypothetical protein
MWPGYGLSTESSAEIARSAGERVSKSALTQRFRKDATRTDGVKPCNPPEEREKADHRQDGTDPRRG